ncbi:MAG: hypothetical protein K9L02_07445 [Acholeplasmataceae bacterium]|nr:hypothetical protein [Acholeplasmataceae bacterium]
MFKRLTTSISRPSKTVFFMKDSWKRVILYILLLPLFLLIPLLLTRLVDHSMSIDRYDAMTEIIEEDFRIENASIVDGVLSYETPINASVLGLFTFYIGDQDLSNRTFNFVFEENGLTFYVARYQIEKVSYADLNLLNHDFSSTDPEALRTLGLALKLYIEEQSYIAFADISAQYIYGLMDYVFIALLMAFVMLLFINHVQFPFKLRFKLSVYLSSIWVVSEFILALFHLEQLEIISMLLVYVYHILAYRSFKVITRVVN